MENSKNTERNTAYLFPGQGSQWSGMGRELYHEHSQAKAVFDEGDKVLGFPLSQLCFQGPQDKLTQTANAQPAVLAVSVACLKTLPELLSEDIYSPPTFVAGHSLGEYTTLVAADVLSLPDALRLVQERGRLMQREVESIAGGMAAIIGLDKESLEEVCRQSEVEIANINSPGQTVISGSKKDLDKAMELAKSRGALRAIPLKVAGAFHSRLMQGATDELSSFISSLPFHDSTIPIIANTSARPLTKAEEIKSELVHQLCHCIQWQNSVEYMIKNGITNFIEVGPGTVLTGLVKRISKEVQATNVGCSPS